TSLKRSRRARGATRLADRRLGANSAWTWELSAKISERLLVFMTFSTPPFHSAGKATWLSLWTRGSFTAEGPNESVPLISADLAQKPKFRRLTQAPYKATSKFRFRASVLKPNSVQRPHEPARPSMAEKSCIHFAISESLAACANALTKVSAFLSTTK